MKSFTFLKAKLLCFIVCFFILVSCDKDNHQEFTEYQGLSVSQNDCFFDNQCLLTENQNLKHDFNTQPPSDDSYIDLVRRYFKNDNQKEFTGYIKRNYGIPLWKGAKILTKEKDGSQIGLFPILRQSSEFIETIMLINVSEDQKSIKFNFVERKNLDKYKISEDTQKEIPYGATILSFGILDKQLFGDVST